MYRPKPKRVVSKADYWRYLRKRYYTLACIASTSFWLLYTVFHLRRFTQIGARIGTPVWVMPSALLLYAFTIFKMTREVRQIEPVEPVSRRNIDRLPAADVLVRGSDAPQTPEAVLLRAAEEQETPQEQLLRAVE